MLLYKFNCKKNIYSHVFVIVCFNCFHVNVFFQEDRGEGFDVSFLDQLVIFQLIPVWCFRSFSFVNIFPQMLQNPMEYC